MIDKNKSTYFEFSRSIVIWIMPFEIANFAII